MDSREIVRRTLDYEHPERVARSFRDPDMVFRGCTAQTHATEWKEVAPSRWERIDEWGNRWGRVDATSKGEVTAGVLQRLEDMEHYTFPDFSNPADYVCVAEARAAHPDKYLIGPLPGMAFNIARKLRKLDAYFIDLLASRDRIHALHDRIDAMLEDMIRNYAAAGTDGIMITEDWGTQGALLIDPALWREEFFPRFERLCGLAKSLGQSVWMHSCGKIEAIVPGLMEAGVDLLQFDQPELHGLEKLAAHQARGRITFWCPVDIQKILPGGDEETIRAKAREMLDILWRGRGGFIAGYYGDQASIGLDPAWQDYACDTFLSHGLPPQTA